MVSFKNKPALFLLWAASVQVESSLAVTQADVAALAARLIAPNSGLTLIDGSYTGSPLAAGTFDTPGPQGLAAGIISALEGRSTPRDRGKTTLWASQAVLSAQRLRLGKFLEMRLS
jgi:hypothetical protein